jgi:hypothetical protein
MPQDLRGRGSKEKKRGNSGIGNGGGYSSTRKLNT